MELKMVTLTEAERLFPGIYEHPVKLYQAEKSVDGYVHRLELHFLSALVKLNNSQCIFEIGTFDGFTTLHLAGNSGEEARVWTLDLPEPPGKTKFPLSASDMSYVGKKQIGVRYRETDVERKITQLLGDSATFDFSPFWGQMDLVFVDGSHQYEYVREDSRNALKLLNGAGIVVWHDYSPSWPGVVRAIDELPLPIYRIKNTTLALLKRENDKN